MIRRSSLAFLFAALFAMSCQTAPVTPDEPEPQEQNQRFDDVSLAINAFGLDLYGYLDDRDGNLIYSPFSISTALAMTYAGARANTATEMAQVLRISEGPGIHGEFGGLIGSLQVEGEDEDDFTLLIANSLWVQMGFSYGVDFLRILEEDYASEMRQVDFRQDPEAARELINQWVEERTRELIPELLPDGILDEDTRLVLVNALYLLAAWQNPFSEDATRPGEFRTGDGEQVEIPMMRQRSRFRHRIGGEYVAVEMPFADSNLSMVAVMPNGSTPQELLEGLTAEELAALTEGLVGDEVQLSFPRFEFDANFLMGEVLEEMGMEEAFSDDANFTGMTRDIPLQIKDVVHEATITVDESGVEAAAATAVIVQEITSSAPRDYVAISFDRPFVFFIRDRDSGVLLFVGQVVDPR